MFLDLFIWPHSVTYHVCNRDLPYILQNKLVLMEWCQPVQLSFNSSVSLSFYSFSHQSCSFLVRSHFGENVFPYNDRSRHKVTWSVTRHVKNTDVIVIKYSFNATINNNNVELDAQRYNCWGLELKTKWPLKWDFTDLIWGGGNSCMQKIQRREHCWYDVGRGDWGRHSEAVAMKCKNVIMMTSKRQ